MKNTFFLLILLLVCLGSCITIKPAAEIKPEATRTPVPVTNVAPQAVNFSEQSTWLLGYFDLNRLTREPYASWYVKGYDDYQLNTDAINKLLEINKDGLTIKIVLGTWCPDSRREVPRFIRVLDIWQFPVSGVTFIGVDNAKLSPVGEYNNLDIQRVPTFIIYKNNNEAGRIIENPRTSLEQDIVNILTRNE
ncbi:MAG: thioredoxin family protein [Bacteroidia bacterium]|nr:thioredoxin family protein [Bacteroidia bacterium]